MKKNFYSNGKLLLTGEYLVLDGATSVAIPTRYGQSLEVNSEKENGIVWMSYDEKGYIWFHGSFRIEDEKITPNTKDKISNTLSDILTQAKKMNPSFLESEEGFLVRTYLNFPRDWGLGSSSTLINNIAEWANIDAFELLKTSFGGSGYDIAVAQNDSPVIFKIVDGAPSLETISIQWDFLDQLFFVHLNKKQDSKEGIARYKMASVNLIHRSIVSAISHSLLVCETLSEFETLLQKHEKIISEIIQYPTVKESLFSDYPKTIKSLGAWGGDFILAVGDEEDRNYFRKKGYETIVPFSEMIL